MITQEDMMKVQELIELHDEAFWHLHQFDGHAKISDGYVGFDISFGTVWDRQEKSVAPRVGVRIYSYVVASSTPSYPNFGERDHWFENLDEALSVMRDWHAKAMSYNPTQVELDEIDNFSLEMWDIIKDKVTIIDATPEEEK